MAIGRASYDPGWRWSVDVGGPAGQSHCMVEHVGLVIAGRAVAAMTNGRVIEMKAGDLFYIAPGHDSWVVGDKPYVSLHFMGAGDYAKTATPQLAAAPPAKTSARSLPPSAAPGSW